MRVGVDIGGTKVAAVLVDDDGNILAESRRPVQADRSREVVLGNIFEAIAEIWREGVRGIGIGCAGYYFDGALRGSPNLPSLDGADLEELVSERFEVPVRVENDANCFALAEFHLGAGRGCQDMIGLIQGTGVGGGIVLDGRILRGRTGSAGEIGHMYLLDGSDWEEHLSGPAIMAQYDELGGVVAEHPGQVWSEDSDIARQVCQELVEKMGLFLGSLINAFNPECIVIGGGVSNLPDDYYEKVSEAATACCVPLAGELTRIVRHEIDAAAGTLGAAMLIQN